MSYEFRNYGQGAVLPGGNASLLHLLITGQRSVAMEPPLKGAPRATLLWLFGSWRRARRFLRQEGWATRGRRRYQGLRGRT